MTGIRSTISGALFLILTLCVDPSNKSLHSSVLNFGISGSFQITICLFTVSSNMKFPPFTISPARNNCTNGLINADFPPLLGPSKIIVFLGVDF
uniref:Uncharacterized protein n=1 Tax=Strigamia maritima TaxID=126957 RepID=T1JF00_STRMM